MNVKKVSFIYSSKIVLPYRNLLLKYLTFYKNKKLEIISQVESGTKVGFATPRSAQVMIGTSGGIEVEVATGGGVQVGSA